MDIETISATNELNFEELTQALHKVCRNNNSLSGLSQQILKEILCEPELDLIPKYLTRKTVLSGSYLWHEGDADPSLGLVVSGQISLMKETDFQDRRIVVGVFNPITLVGEISFVDGHPQALTAKATQTTDIFLLSRGSFEKLVADCPHLGKKIIRGLLYLFATRHRTLLNRMGTVF